MLNIFPAFIRKVPLLSGKIILCLFFLLFPIISLFGQYHPRFVYDYDNSGNRIQRMFIPSRLANPEDTVTQFAQNIGVTKITVLPNPTNGAFEVQIDKIKDDVAAQILIYDIKGLLLSKTNNAGSSTPFDITDKPSGSYIIRVNIGEKKKEWRLLKM